MHIEAAGSHTIELITHLFIEKILAKLMAGVWGIVLSIYSGHEALIALMVALYVVDFSTGILKTLKSRDFSSRKFFRGATKLVVYGICLLVAHALDMALHTSDIWMSFMLAYVIVNDSISILENLEELSPGSTPKFLAQYLSIVRRRLEEQVEELSRK